MLAESCNFEGSQSVLCGPLVILELADNSPIRVEQVSEDRVQD